jgi:hypothetical protein
MSSTKTYGVLTLLLSFLLVGWQLPSQAWAQGCQRGSGSMMRSMSAYRPGGGGYPTAGLGNLAGQQAYPQLSTDPYAAAAAALNAQGQLMVNQMQASLIQQQLVSAQLANRRTQFDETLYETANTPTAEQQRQRLFAQQLFRSLNSPPLTEIWSGQALNVLLVDLSQTPGDRSSTRLSTFTLPLDEADLRSIRLTAAGRPTSVDFLQNNGELRWPLALTSDSFQEARQGLTQSVKQAVQERDSARNPDPVLAGRLAAEVDRMQAQLKQEASTLSCQQYRDARAFLNRLGNDVRTLQAQPQMGSASAGKALVQVKTVPELVRRMSDTGLAFAPAGPGEEAAYKALHQALVLYDRELHPTR